MPTIVPDFSCYYETLILKYGNSHLTNYWLYKNLVTNTEGVSDRAKTVFLLRIGISSHLLTTLITIPFQLIIYKFQFPL